MIIKLKIHIYIQKKILDIPSMHKAVMSLDVSL